MKINILFAVIGVSLSTQLLAGLPPVAIVEDIQADGSTLSFMDYVNEGRVIQLGKQGKVTLGYLNSCRRETITGGTVKVGARKSDVKDGSVLGEVVECDGGDAKLTGQQAATSGALAFRGSAPKKQQVGLARAELTIYGTAPVVRLKQANLDITIERVDKRSKSYQYHVNGKHIDLADKRLSLELGGIYRISANNGTSKTFKIDKYAEMGKISIVSRLIDL